MDPLDVMTNLENILPYFQAIFSADTQQVIGYEISGKIKTDMGIQGLGSFFQDTSVPDEYRLEVDNSVMIKGLDFLLKNTHDELIFIYRDADLLLLDSEDTFLQLLLAYADKGIQLNRFVIEITEHHLTEDLESLNHLLTYYRTYGIRVAIDNIGKERTNLDRIGVISPDILKIDLKAILQSNTLQFYNDVLFSISMLARKLGATLLYENIETNFQLQYAWKNGGRYYQGGLLHIPSEDVVAKDLLKSRLKEEFHRFITHEKSKLQLQHQLSEQFDQRVLAVLTKQKKTTDYNQLLSYMSEAFSDCSFRIYVCDENGFQKSANIVKSQEKWELYPEYYLKNWSWRPYFLENIVKMKYTKKGFLSDLYRDLETGEIVRTFSFPLAGEHYLFIDLSYNYLFSQNGLL